LFSYLEWLGELVKVIGDLIPRRILVEPTHQGVKFKGMKHTLLLLPGRYWYIPFFSSYYLLPVVRQSLYTLEQDLTTLDGKPVKLRAVVSYEITDVVTAIAKAYEVTDQIDDETMGLICRYTARKTLDELMDDRTRMNREITSLVDRRMEEYGISIKRVQITSFISGRVLLHTGIDISLGEPNG
jgi:regulator of protease activity HflC (stomatin/prohibitin superfamily)